MKDKHKRQVSEEIHEKWFFRVSHCYQYKYILDRPEDFVWCEGLHCYSQPTVGKCNKSLLLYLK